MQLLISEGSSTKLPRRIGSLVFQRSPGGVRIGRGRVVKQRLQFLAKNGQSYFALVAEYAVRFKNEREFVRQQFINVAAISPVPSRLGGRRFMSPLNAYVKFFMFIGSRATGIIGFRSSEYIFRPPPSNFAKFTFIIYWSSRYKSYILRGRSDEPRSLEFEYKYYNFEGSYFVPNASARSDDSRIPAVIKSPRLRYFVRDTHGGLPAHGRTILVKDIPVLTRAPGDTTSFT